MEKHGPRVARMILTELVNLFQILGLIAAAAFYLAFAVPIAIRHARGVTTTFFHWIVLVASAVPLLFSVWMIESTPNMEPEKSGPSIVEGQ